MLEFARRYDPQPIHVNGGAAREPVFGHLFAAGWLTAALSARLLAMDFMNITASRGGGEWTTSGGTNRCTPTTPSRPTSR